MYGVIFEFLREYVVERHGGKDTWSVLLKQATGSAYTMYFPVKDYPDEDIVKLAVTASKALGVPVDDVLEDFGTFVGPRLTKYYKMYIKGECSSTFHLIDLAGSSIHDAIHRHNPDRKPPLLYGVAQSSKVMLVHYKSHRKLCQVVKGIIRGLADHYGETLEIKQTECIHHGAQECIFRVEKR